MTGPSNSLSPRILDGRFTKALVLENPDPLLDKELEALGIQVDRLARGALSALLTLETLLALRTLLTL